MIAGLVLAFIGLLAFSCWVFHGRGQAGYEPKPAPLFEEAPSVPQGFHGAVGKIDKAVYQVFFAGGVEERNISFERVSTQWRNGVEWELAELSVNCGSERGARELARALARDSDIGDEPRVRAHILSSSAEKIVVEICRGDLRTHLISLVWGVQADRKRYGYPKIAIIIDDLGYDRRMAASLMSLDFPLNLSVLPYAPFSRDVLREAENRGLEVLLHLPMEPKRYPEVDPGKGALLLDMEEAELVEALKGALAQLPGVRGVNNHMGSAFCEDRAKMQVVLRYLHDHDLFYLDSRTSSGSVALEVAEQIGVPAVRRNVFLDDDPSLEAVQAQMERLLNLARHSGCAVGIGHPYPTTLEILRSFASGTNREFEVVAVSQLTCGE